MPNKPQKALIGRNRRYAPPVDVVRDYGLGRDRVKKMIREKKVRTILIRSPDAGSNRSVRLIDLNSLEAYLNQFATEVEP